MLVFTPPAFSATPDLGQGWSDPDREWFYFTTQGSRLVRRDWFLAVERHDSLDLLTADGLARFGYLPAAKSAANPDQLPVGFAVDTADSREWVGMTCAACHTSEVSFRGTTLRVEGAPGAADMYDFLAKLDLALQKAANDDAAFLRFAARVLGAQNNDANRKKLRDDLKTGATGFAKFVRQSTPSTRWGPARLDAFGMIFNRVTSIDLGIDKNSVAPDAPVSYPFLWGTSWHDYTQWNGAVPNDDALKRLARNTGQVLGVFGTIDFGTKFGYRSSANRKNLAALEVMVSNLKAPVWPTALFGVPDPARVARGEVLYRDNCSNCHKLVSVGNQLQPARVTVVPASVLNTDDAMTRMSATRDAATGQLQGRPVDFIPLPGAPTMKDREKATTILSHAVIGALVSIQVADTTKARVTKPLFDPSVAIGNYKARPLNGIWATAPYLHNGSVRTLYQLLLPPDKREAKFLAGSREFDPVEVGFASAAATWPGAVPFEFDTNVAGNNKTGHVYGTGLTEEQRRDLVEYMKTL